MLVYHFPNPAGVVESLKEVIVSLVLQLLPVKVSLHEVRQPSNLGFGGIRNVAKDIIDFKHEIRLALGGEFPGCNLDGFL
jgi:hypothetical protein